MTQAYSFNRRRVAPGLGSPTPPQQPQVQPPARGAQMVSGAIQGMSGLQRNASGGYAAPRPQPQARPQPYALGYSGGPHAENQSFRDFFSQYTGGANFDNAMRQASGMSGSLSGGYQMTPEQMRTYLRSRGSRVEQFPTSYDDRGIGDGAGWGQPQFTPNTPQSNQPGNVYGTQGSTPWSGRPNSNNPYWGKNWPGAPVSGDFRNAVVDAQFLPWIGTEGMPNPNDAYGRALPGAQDFLGGAFRQGNPYANPSGNRFADMGYDMLRNGPGGPNFNFSDQPLPNQPDIGRGYYMPPGQDFRGPRMPSVTGPNVPSIGSIDRGGFAGPNVSPVTQPNYDFSGPNSGIEAATRLAREFGGGGGGYIPRENLQQSRFDQSGLGADAFRGAFAGASNQANAGIDEGMLGAQLKAIKGQGDQLIQNAISSGVAATARSGSPTPGGYIGQGEVGQRIAQVIPEINRQMADARLGAADRAIQQQQYGTGALTGLGSAASSALLGTQGLNLNATQGINEGNLTQRGQDINQSQFMQQYGGANLGNLASLINATSGASRGAYEAATGRAGMLGGLSRDIGGMNQDAALRGYDLASTRGLGMGAQDLARQTANQDALLRGYGAATDRTGMLGGLSNDAYRAATDRYGTMGDVGARFADINRQGLNDYNTSMLDRYRTAGGLANERYGMETGRYGAMADAYNTGQRNYYDFLGNMTAEQNRRDLGYAGIGADYTTGMAGIARDIMSGGAQGTQFMNELQAQADAGNRDAAMQLILLKLQLADMGQARRMGRTDAVVGGVIGGLGSVGRALLGNPALFGSSAVER